MYRYNRSFAIATTIALTVIARMSWLPTPVLAQTPHSNVYAVTVLDNIGATKSVNGFGATGGISNGIIAGQGNLPDSAARRNADGSMTYLSNVSNIGNLRNYASDTENGVVVGYYERGYYEDTNAIRWNADNTITDLNALTNLGPNSRSRAYAIANGVIVGTGASPSTSGRQNALRWNADGTVTNLHALANLSSTGYSYALGTGGGDAVGYYVNPGEDHYSAILWKADNTVINLHTQANIGTGYDSYALGVSGGTAVGYYTNSPYSTAPGARSALRWNADGTVTNLNNLTNMGTGRTSLAFSVANGVTVGQAGGSKNNTFSLHAHLWNADNTVVDLHSFVNIAAVNDSFHVYDSNPISAAYVIDSVTGMIAGGIGYKSVLWTPLNAGTNGANSLTVLNRTTTIINRDFTQSAGETKVNGTLAFDTDTNTANGVKKFTLAGGTLSGAGTITGNLVNTGGIVSPGNSPGTMTVNGNYTQSGNGILKIEIASLSDFDVFNILGNASFGGTLDISFLNGYTPSLGDAFNFINVSGIQTGTFDTIKIGGGNFSERGLSATLNPSTGGKGFTFAVVAATGVPESSTLALIGLAVPILGTIAIRRKNK